MKILYSPQRNDNKMIYTFEEDKITAEYLGKTDTFDFTNFPEGATISNINTTLAINPITSVKRENGILYIELLYFHGADATQEELFPTWQEVEMVEGEV